MRIIARTHFNFASILILFSLLTTLPSCAQEGNKESEVTVVSKTDFKEKIAAEENPQIIDVRTPSEVKNGKIEGAINYNFLDGSLKKNLDQLDSEKPVFVYCAAGGRSAKAAKLLKDNGFKSIIDLKGGYNAWSK